jgi:hypothetical protein
MIDREIDREKELVEAAASVVRIPVSNGDFTIRVKPPVAALNAFADERAGNKPIRPEVIENGDREAREELADCRSYLAWTVLHGDRQSGNDLRAMAIGHVAAAYHLIELAGLEDDQ